MDCAKHRPAIEDRNIVVPGRKVNMAGKTRGKTRPERSDRLAKALRDNLAKRKEQRRKRAAGGGAGAPAGQEDRRR